MQFIICGDVRALARRPALVDEQARLRGPRGRPGAVGPAELRPAIVRDVQRHGVGEGAEKVGKSGSKRVFASRIIITRGDAHGRPRLGEPGRGGARPAPAARADVFPAFELRYGAQTEISGRALLFDVLREHSSLRQLIVQSEHVEIIIEIIKIIGHSHLAKRTEPVVGLRAVAGEAGGEGCAELAAG